MLRGKKYWNTAASEYHSGRTKGRKYIVDPALFEVIGEVSDKRILDVACGTGAIIIPLAQIGAKCVGIDYSKDLIQLAREDATSKGLDIDYRVMDATEVQKLESKFDLVIVALLFPHLPQLKDIAQTIASISKVLEDTGRLIIAEPHPSFDYYMKNRMAYGDFQYFSSGLPYEFQMDIGEHSLKSEAYHWTLENYSQALFDSGFLIRRIVEPRPLPESRDVSTEWYKEKIKYPTYIIFDCIKQK